VTQTQPAGREWARRCDGGTDRTGDQEDDDDTSSSASRTAATASTANCQGSVSERSERNAGANDRADRRRRRSVEEGSHRGVLAQVIEALGADELRAFANAATVASSEVRDLPRAGCPHWRQTINVGFRAVDGATRWRPAPRRAASSSPISTSERHANPGALPLTELPHFCSVARSTPGGRRAADPHPGRRSRRARSRAALPRPKRLRTVRRSAS